MSMWPDLFMAEGNFVSVVPLTMEHHDDLVEAAGDGELHRLWYTKVPEPANIGSAISAPCSHLPLLSGQVAKPLE